MPSFPSSDEIARAASGAGAGGSTRHPTCSLLVTAGPLSASDVSAGQRAGVQVLHVGAAGVFPLSRPYVVNRLAQVATGQRLVVVGAGPARVERWIDAAGSASPVRRLGRTTWAFERQAFFEAGGLDHALGRAAPTELALRLSGRPTAARVLRRAAYREADLSPRSLLAHLPAGASPELRQAVGDAIPLPPSHRAKTHYLYLLPGLGVLHLYVNPGRRLLAGVVEREAVRLRAPAARVPAAREVLPGTDSLWLLEEEVVGPSLTGPASGWWQGACRWLQDLAGPPGPPLGGTGLWSDHAARALELVDPAQRHSAAGVLQRVATWPSRHQHGDLQPKNVVRTSAGLAAVDWEGVWSQGLPGLDLLFLAVMATGSPDPDAVARLVRGQEPVGRPVLAVLRAWGVAPDELPVLVAACLLVWSLGEAQRVARLGAPPGRAGSTWARWRSDALAAL